MKLDKAQPYGTIYGHALGSFMQNGKMFDAAGNLVIGTPVVEEKLETDAAVSAKEFLRNILNDRTLAKSAIYKAAEDNNQPWAEVKPALEEIGSKSFMNKVEMWKLKEAQ